MGSSQLQPAQVNEFNGDVLAAAGGLGGDFSRFFEAFRHMGSTRYIGSARNLINAGSNAQYFDIPVGQSFIENWRREQTGDSIRSRDAIYTLTDDVKRIFGYSGLQITASHDETTFQLVVEGRSYSLTELGSGLAQFILTFGAVAGKEQDYILIDEPELNLHPSLQLDFLTSMAAYAKKGVLFATHSYGLARSSANLIYSVQRRQLHLASSEVRPIEGMPRLSEFLGELGYAGYRELGFDKVLLVEGQSELTTIQQLLRILRKDHQVVLLPLGGSASINANAAGQLEEIKRICDNISALIDSERQSADAPLDGNRQGFVDACKEAKIPCHVLNRRAFENYFPEHAIRAEKGSKFRALLPYEKLGDASPAWGKNENWRIARRMVDADLGGNDNDLGAFLKSL
jgi:energy-coupling factor transporter ATP-binding protein EcfA2